MGKLRAKKSTRVHLKAAHFDATSSVQSSQDKKEWNILKPASFDLNNIQDEKSEEDNWIVVKNARSNSAKSLKYNKKLTNDSKSSSLRSSTHFQNYQKLLPINIESNPFSGIKIKTDAVLKQKLNYNPPEKPAIKPKVVKCKNKKNRIQQRRDYLIKKLEVSAAIKAQEKKAIQRAKAPVVGDMSFLKMSLSDVSSKPKDKKKKKRKKSLKPKAENKFKKTQKNKTYKGLTDVLKFQNSLKNTNGKSKSDIKQMILENIKNHC